MTATERKYLLLPERLFTPAVFLVSLGWMEMLHLLDYQNNSGIAPTYQRALVLFVVHFTAFVPPALVFFLFRSRFPAERLVTLMVVAVLAGAGLRGYFQFLGLNLISDRPLDDVVFRIAASMTNSGFAILIAWAGFSASEQHKRRRQRLLEDRESLLLLRHQAREQFERIDSGAAEEIRASLLDSLHLQTQTTSADLVASMRGVIDDVVRPLSQYFEQQSDNWLPPEPRKRLLKIQWRAVLGNAFRPENISPAPIISMLIWTSLPNTFFHRGAWIAAVSTLLCLTGLWILDVVKRVGVRLAADRSRLWKGFVFFFGLYLGGETLGVMSLVYTQFQAPRYFYVLFAPLFTVVGGALIAFAQAALTESEAMEEALSRIGSELRWSVARAREMHRQQRRALAHGLHGQIQAAVASAILRVEMSSKKDQYSPEVAKEIVDSLKSTVANVNLLANTNVPLEVVLERVSTTWEGIATISTQVDSSVAERLAGDSVCAVALNDVLTELTYNSIKHGSASEVTIELAEGDHRTLTVAVTDNGRPLGVAERRGLGSALLDDCAISWERSRSGDRTRTMVQLPLE